jgi:hypothetical protein
MLSKFFLDRPVFAWVIAIIMMTAGGLAIYNLPVAQYPPIAPPAIAIDSFLSRGLRRNGREQRHPDHRAEDDRPGRHALPLRHQFDRPAPPGSS